LNDDKVLLSWLPFEANEFIQVFIRTLLEIFYLKQFNNNKAGENDF